MLNALVSHHTPYYHTQALLENKREPGVKFYTCYTDGEVLVRSLPQEIEGESTY